MNFASRFGYDWFTSFCATFFNQVIISFCVAVIRIKEICKYNSVLCDFHVFHCISLIYHIIIRFLEKYVRIKIKDSKILVRMSILSSKLDEVIASYACNKYNSVLWDFRVFHCISSIYHIIMLFFPEQYVRMKIEDHKILLLMNKLSPNLDEINASYVCKYNSVL